MAKFKVGDKVRFVKTDNGLNQLIGKEAEIIGVGGFDTAEGDIREYLIKFLDGTTPADVGVGGPKNVWASNSYQLEPIIPLGSWSDLEATINWNPTKTPISH